MPAPRTGFTAPLWASGFRPFFLLGVGYGAALMFAWAFALAAPDAVPWPAFAARSWHAREMLFGFAVAIVAGVVLTGLPSWAGTDEVHGSPLAWLAALWTAGRAGVWLASASGIAWIALVDLLFVPALFAIVAPQLLRVKNRRYLLLLPVLAALFTVQLASHEVDDPSGAGAGAMRVASQAAVYAIVVLYGLVGGLFTSVFTGNALREHGRGDQAPFLPALEAVAVALVVALAALDLGGASDPWIGIAALACALVHGWRVARWRGWRAADDRIVLAMNLGFAWLVAAFALRAAAALGGLVPADAWVHAFTVGSLGMMMIGLMTRVVLRHTGRPLAVPPLIVAAGASMFAAALLRLAASVHGLGNAPVALSALLWALAFSAWFARCAPMLLAPSLPRKPAPAPASNSVRE
ncbi:MAG: NnrS family protein [Burkholderiales bacterium]|nr:MAG: NnrS family protein [Burkholderiales bacterium]